VLPFLPFFFRSGPFSLSFQSPFFLILSFFSSLHPPKQYKPIITISLIQSKLATTVSFNPIID
jgi:hypothetical protein